VSAAIQVEREKEGVFRVRVREASTTTSHIVTIRPEYCQKLTRGSVTAEELVRRSFDVSSYQPGNTSLWDEAYIRYFKLRK